MEVEAEVKPRGVTTRDERGDWARGELVLLWRGVGEDGLDGGWSKEERAVLAEERFPSCWRCCCDRLREDGVGVGVPGGLTGSRLAGLVGVVGVGDRPRDGVDGEGGKRGAGRDFLCREEDADAGELAFVTEGRFGVSWAGGLIMGRPGGDEEDVGDDGEVEACEERWTVGEESEASLSEGVTKLVNPGNRNRCGSLPYSPGRLSCLSESSFS